jgi:glycosyltransferase involved in cell wall biosynthesis
VTPVSALRLVVVGPPLDASGGIGRVMSSVLATLRPEEVRVEVLDTRGHRRNPVASIVPLLTTCATILVRAARRQVDVVHVNSAGHGSAVRKGVVVRACRLARVPVVLHLHAGTFPAFFDPLPGPAKRWVRRTFALATSVIVLTENWRRYAGSALAVPAERTVVVPNGTPAVTAPAPPRLPGEDLHLLFLGRLEPAKGVPELLAALGRPVLAHRPWRATLAGDGDVEGYRALAARLGLAGRVDFPGQVDAGTAAGLLARAHALVLPSHAEGLSLAVLEALAAGVPVVCTPVGGLPEAVRHGANGLLVPEGDVDGLAAALLRLLDDESLRRRLAAEARETWRRAYSLEVFVDRLVAEWYAAAGRRPARAGDARVRVGSGN